MRDIETWIYIDKSMRDFFTKVKRAVVGLFHRKPQPKLLSSPSLTPEEAAAILESMKAEPDLQCIFNVCFFCLERAGVKYPIAKSGTCDFCGSSFRTTNERNWSVGSREAA